MSTVWSFEAGRLTAKDDSGRVINSWIAERIMGVPLADLLNVNASLSNLLLRPWQQQWEDIVPAKLQTGP